jgi:plastocyanin
MEDQPRLVVWFRRLLLCLLLTGLTLAEAQNQSSLKYTCREANPSTLCNISNRCGSESEPCIVDVRRQGSSATVKPNIPNAKSNAPFCVKVGTTVTWQTSGGNTGFVVDFGSSSPFDTSGAIIGGSDRPISVVAKRAGCYKFSMGACIAGTIKGMCGSKTSELVVTSDQN